MSGAMPQHYQVPQARRLGWETDTSIYLHGSSLLQPVADRFGIELDQVNFLFCEIVGIIGGSCIRLFLPANSHDRKMRQMRLLTCGLLGIMMAFFCFGLRSMYLWAVTTLCYMISKVTSPRYSHLIVFLVAVGYLSYLHIYRMLKDYGGYSLDITMPMMVIVQKITAFAFAVHDGAKDPKRLKLPDQPGHAIKQIPSYWEFLSYVFSFQSLLCGPFCFFNEYIDFIEGNSIPANAYKKTDDQVKPVDSASSSQIQSGHSGTDGDVLLPPAQMYPSPMWSVLKKVSLAVFLCYVHVTLVPGVPLDLLTKEDNINKLTFIQLMFYLLIATTFVRLKYYVAWLLSDAVANASGLGFNGYDELGKPKWDLVSNVDIIEFEFSQNLRGAIVAWNTCTARWLRYVAYDRARFLPMMATYTLSAFWHGFYPGYYVTFVGGALFTEAARWGRRAVRHYFQKWRATRLVYDFITFLATRICLAYVTFPFVLLELRYAWNIYKALYFWCHILALLAILILPQLAKMERKGRRAPSSSSNRDKEVDGDSTMYNQSSLKDGIVRPPLSPTSSNSALRNTQLSQKPITG